MIVDAVTLSVSTLILRENVIIVIRMIGMIVYV